MLNSWRIFIFDFFMYLKQQHIFVCVYVFMYLPISNIFNNTRIQELCWLQRTSVYVDTYILTYIRRDLEILQWISGVNRMLYPKFYPVLLNCSTYALNTLIGKLATRVKSFWLPFCRLCNTPSLETNTDVNWRTLMHIVVQWRTSWS